jgi:hypothetical protein
VDQHPGRREGDKHDARKIDAIRLIVKDLARSVRVYRGLGAPFPEGAETSEQAHAEAHLGGDIRLMLDTESGIATFDPTWQSTDELPGSR